MLAHEHNEVLLVIFCEDVATDIDSLDFLHVVLILCLSL